MIADRELARVNIVTAIEGLRATAPTPNVLVEYDNMKLVNVSTEQKPYLKVWIHYIDGEQIGLGPNSGERAMGTLIVEARAREGTGTSALNKLIDYFYKALQRTDAMFPVRTKAAKHVSPPNLEGWSRIGVAIPFYWDSLP